MTLGFSVLFDDEPNYFIEKIWQSLFDASDMSLSKIYGAYLLRHVVAFGKEWDVDPLKEIKPKLHTIRTDKHNKWRAGLDIHFVINDKMADSFQFAPVRKSIAVQDIELYINANAGFSEFAILIDGKALNKKEIEIFACNDGFENTANLFKYFNNSFKGKLVHWTNLKY